jgi:hypothetical protein
MFPTIGSRRVASFDTAQHHLDDALAALEGRLVGVAPFRAG